MICKYLWTNAICFEQLYQTLYNDVMHTTFDKLSTPMNFGFSDHL